LSILCFQLQLAPLHLGDHGKLFSDLQKAPDEALVLGDDEGEEGKPKAEAGDDEDGSGSDSDSDEDDEFDTSGGAVQVESS
jgi:hypothetical protein